MNVNVGSWLPEQTCTEARIVMVPPEAREAPSSLEPNHLLMSEQRGHNGASPDESRETSRAHVRTCTLN